MMTVRMSPLRRLTFGYVLSLLAIAAILVVGQQVVAGYLARQALDARLVDVAGRQRMLSQRVCLHALALASAPSTWTDADRAARLDMLARDAREWAAARRALHDDATLSGGTLANTDEAYARVDETQQAMLATVRGILAHPGQIAAGAAELLTMQEAFLAGMDSIVLAYDRDATARVTRLAQLDRILLAVALATLLVEGAFVFTPLVRHVRKAFDELVATQHALEASLAEQRGLEMKLIDATDTERRKLGEELHDGLCQHLVGVTYLLRSVQQSTDDATQKRLDEVTGLLEEANEQVRGVAQGLHPVGVDQYGLGGALAQLKARIETAFGLRCEVHCDEAPELGPGVAAHLFRIAQEALANAAKHASAKHVDVSVRVGASEISLEIADDGIGLDPGTPRGMGLFTMSSRATMMGGSFDITRRATGGTVVRCKIPRTTPLTAPTTARSHA